MTDDPVQARHNHHKSQVGGFLMLNVTVIDCSHKDRPSHQFTASEVISSSTGTLILSPRTSPNPTPHVNSILFNSIYGLCRDINQGFDFTLSHDWVVKVHG